MPIHGINSAGILIPPTVDWSRPLDRITGGRRPPGGGSSSWGGGGSSSWGGGSGGGSSRWDDDGDSSSSGGWNSGSSGGSGWNGGGSNRWGGSSSGSNNWDGSARSRNWGPAISAVGVIDQGDLPTAAEVPPFLNFVSSTDNINSANSSSVANSSRSIDDDAADSGTGTISSTEQVTWWGSTQATGPHPLGACTANPRTSVDSSSGLAANTPWVVSYWADLTPGTTCQFTRTSLAATACSGSQLAPYLVLLAAHCVDPTLLKLALPACPGLELVSARACYSFNRAPRGPFNCTDNGINAVGASWYPRAHDASLGPVTPSDQAILFMSTSRPGPFYTVSFCECPQFGPEDEES